MPSQVEQIKTLEIIEKELVLCIQSAGNALQELSKEKPSQKSAENHASQFLKSLNSIENKLSEQINYLLQVSTTTSHEGSGYASAKTLQMAWHRIQNVKDRIKELEDCTKRHELKNAGFQQANTIRQPQQPPTQ